MRNGPAIAVGRQRIEAAGRLGTLELLNQFSGVFPDQGPYSGGTVVTVIGHHLTYATAVFFGPRPAASFAVLDDETIVAVSPSGSGAVPVTVTTPGGTAPLGLFFSIHWPGLAGIVPVAGPLGGGNIVELSGINLSTALLAHFGDAVAHPTAVSDQQVLVTAPPVSGPGTVPVHVTTIGGVSNRLLCTYAAAPARHRCQPGHGVDRGRRHHRPDKHRAPASPASPSAVSPRRPSARTRTP
ncbi:IPT/TIG domain-containing protein [Streptomyces sp. NPDC005336]|uniref:IPT/TIG domain-containing protein n=1 Tax=Streptomyces sp. NPDC005336 TaxID=3157035 RepID=UPI0033B6E244